MNILTSADTWFRPSDVCVGPDGALYVADWNDAGVGGHNMADRDLATMTGRVYRVAPPGFKSTPPRLDLKTANLYDFAGDLIKCVRIFSDRQEALDILGMQE